jgi:hypothetical protein
MAYRNHMIPGRRRHEGEKSMSDEKTAGTFESAYQAEQLKQIALENKKLELEISQVEGKKPRYQTLLQLLPIIPAIIATAGFLWGVKQYLDEQEASRVARTEQARREEQTAEREFMQPWLKSQRETYLAALEAATIAANATDPVKRTRAEEDFWRLYHGKMILVETTQVSDAMRQFGLGIGGEDGDQPRPSKRELNRLCRILGTAMAESMAATAKVTYREFAASQFKYRDRPPEDGGTKLD